MDEEILDYTEKKKRPNRWYNAVMGLALALFFYWFLSGFFGWPFGNWALFTGLLLLLVVTVIRFLAKRRRRAFEWFYFIGKLILFTAIFLRLTHYPFAIYFIVGALALFVLGLVSVSSKKT